MPPEELAGKYKKPFERLKQQLKEDLEEYLKLFILDGITILSNDEGHQIIDQINQAWQEAQIGKQIGRAAYREFDLEKIKAIAQEHRQRVMRIYKAYKENKTTEQKEDNHGQAGKRKEI